MSPLWPVKHNTSTPSAVMSMGIAPTVWEASKISSAPWAWAISAMRAMSSISPVRLEAWVHTTALVLGRNSGAKSS